MGVAYSNIGSACNIKNVYQFVLD